MGPDIIVTALSGSVDSGNFSSPGPIGPVGTAHIATGQLLVAFGKKEVFTKNDDVKDPDIIVIGKNLQDKMRDYYLNFGMNARDGIIKNIPCIGRVKTSEIANILGNLKFNVTTKDYGQGRAGENNVGIGNSQVPVSINQDALKGYNALSGGLDYLILHEVAHALKVMQEYNKEKWNSYVNGEGRKLTLDQQQISYPNTKEFNDNEARANTISKYLYGKRKPDWNFEPNNGYQIC